MPYTPLPAAILCVAQRHERNAGTRKDALGGRIVEHHDGERDGGELQLHAVGDGVADDSVALKKYLASSITIDEIAPQNSDLNGDGLINVQDLKELKMLIAS